MQAFNYLLVIKSNVSTISSRETVHNRKVPLLFKSVKRLSASMRMASIRLSYCLQLNAGGGQMLKTSRAYICNRSVEKPQWRVERKSVQAMDTPSMSQYPGKSDVNAALNGAPNSLGTVSQCATWNKSSMAVLFSYILRIYAIF